MQLTDFYSFNYCSLLAFNYFYSKTLCSMLWVQYVQISYDVTYLPTYVRYTNDIFYIYWGALNGRSARPRNSRRKTKCHLLYRTKTVNHTLSAQRIRLTMTIMWNVTAHSHKHAYSIFSFHWKSCHFGVEMKDVFFEKKNILPLAYRIVDVVPALWSVG